MELSGDIGVNEWPKLVISVWYCSSLFEKIPFGDQEEKIPVNPFKMYISYLHTIRQLCEMRLDTTL